MARMSRADVLATVDRPSAPPATAEAIVELAVDQLLRSHPQDGFDRLRALDAVARAAARLIAERRPERRPVDADAPVPMAGWWTFASQLPEVGL
jgi:hypothetical protein